MIWAKGRNRVLDAFVVVTPFLKDWEFNAPTTSPFYALNSYKEEMKLPDARFVF
jgi:hypothetical protein